MKFIMNPAHVRGTCRSKQQSKTSTYQEMRIKQLGLIKYSMTVHKIKTRFHIMSVYTETKVLTFVP